MRRSRDVLMVIPKTISVDMSRDLSMNIAMDELMHISMDTPM